MSGERKPPIYCGATINGPKVGRHVVLWRKWCRIRVRNDGDRCRYHGGPCLPDEVNERTTRGCAACGGKRTCRWADDAWVCRRCGAEWMCAPDEVNEVET